MTISTFSAYRGFDIDAFSESSEPSTNQFDAAQSSPSSSSGRGYKRWRSSDSPLQSSLSDYLLNSAKRVKNSPSDERIQCGQFEKAQRQEDRESEKLNGLSSGIEFPKTPEKKPLMVNKVRHSIREKSKYRLSVGSVSSTLPTQVLSYLDNPKPINEKSILILESPTKHTALQQGVIRDIATRLPTLQEGFIAESPTKSFIPESPTKSFIPDSPVKPLPQEKMISPAKSLVSTEFGRSFYSPEKLSKIESPINRKPGPITPTKSSVSSISIGAFSSPESRKGKLFPAHADSSSMQKFKMKERSPSVENACPLEDDEILPWDDFCADMLMAVREQEIEKVSEMIKEFKNSLKQIEMTIAARKAAILVLEPRTSTAENEIKLELEEGTPEGYARAEQVYYGEGLAYDETLLAYHQGDLEYDIDEERELKDEFNQLLEDSLNIVMNAEVVNTPLLKLLLESGVDLWKGLVEKQSDALAIASAMGDLDLVSFILDKFDLISSSHLERAVSNAIGAEQIETVKLLMDKGKFEDSFIEYVEEKVRKLSPAKALQKRMEDSQFISSEKYADSIERELTVKYLLF